MLVFHDRSLDFRKPIEEQIEHPHMIAQAVGALVGAVSFFLYALISNVESVSVSEQKESQCFIESGAPLAGALSTQLTCWVFSCLCLVAAVVWTQWRT